MKPKQIVHSSDHWEVPAITGKNYRPSCGKCNVPNWEGCACSSLLAPCAHVEPTGSAHGEWITNSLNREADERLQLALGL